MINRKANEQPDGRRGQRQDIERRSDFPAREAEASDRYYPP